jgi:hypothetical protein
VHSFDEIKDSMRTLSKKYFGNYLAYLMIQPCISNCKEYNSVVLNNTPVFKAAIYTGSNNRSKMVLTKNLQKRKSFYNSRRQPSKNFAQLPHLLSTGNASRNNVPNKRLLSETLLCAILGTLRARFCLPDNVLDVPDIIWNIVPNIIRHIFLLSDL